MHNAPTPSAHFHLTKSPTKSKKIGEVLKGEKMYAGKKKNSGKKKSEPRREQLVRVKVVKPEGESRGEFLKRIQGKILSTPVAAFNVEELPYLIAIGAGEIHTIVNPHLLKLEAISDNWKSKQQHTCDSCARY